MALMLKCDSTYLKTSFLRILPIETTAIKRLERAYSISKFSYWIYIIFYVWKANIFIL